MAESSNNITGLIHSGWVEPPPSDHITHASKSRGLLTELAALTFKAKPNPDLILNFKLKLKSVKYKPDPKPDHKH